MQFDVPNTALLTSQILNPGRGAGRGLAPPRGMPVPQSVCVRLVCATGYGTRHANRACVRRRANDTTEAHTIIYAGRASLCVCCSRGGLDLLTSPVGVESQRPETTKAFHNNRFIARDPIGVISHVITSSSLPSLSSSAQVGHPSAALRWLAFCVQRCRCARR